MTETKMKTNSDLSVEFSNLETLSVLPKRLRERESTDEDTEHQTSTSENTITNTVILSTQKTKLDRKKKEGKMESYEDQEGQVRFLLHCPFHLKDQIKAMGGRWDMNRREWYVRSDYQYYQAMSIINEGRMFFDIPFKKKDFVKSVGAKWDPKYLVWYTYDHRIAQQIVEKLGRKVCL